MKHKPTPQILALNTFSKNISSDQSLNQIYKNLNLLVKPYQHPKIDVRSSLAKILKSNAYYKIINQITQFSLSSSLKSKLPNIFFNKTIFYDHLAC